MGKLKVNGIIVLGFWAFSTIVFLSFQNCSKMYFEGAGRGSLVSKIDDPAVNNQGDVSDAGSTIGADTTNPITPPPVPEQDVVVEDPPTHSDPLPPPAPEDDDQRPNHPKQDQPVVNNPPPTNGDDKKPDEPKEHKQPVVDSESDNDQRLYVCVLQGPGSSIKVGFKADVMDGGTGTPNDVCMTKHACLSILTDIFSVKGAEKRGFCPDRNPHVVSMSDHEIQSYVDEQNRK